MSRALHRSNVRSSRRLRHHSGNDGDMRCIHDGENGCSRCFLAFCFFVILLFCTAGPSLKTRADAAKCKAALDPN
jgi:hypothetical protein